MPIGVHRRKARIGMYLLLFHMAPFHRLRRVPPSGAEPAGGVFSRLLPRVVFAVAGFYLVAGIFALLVSHTEGAAGTMRFSPWLMAGPFGVGQAILAAILYVKLERTHD